MNKLTVALATITAVSAGLAGTLSLAGPATAGGGCNPASRSALIPYLTSPCRGVEIRRRTKSVTFTVYDGDSEARPYPPFLNLRTNAVRVHGHLPADQDGNGIYSTLQPVKGHPGRFTYTAHDQIFKSYWLNHPGNEYVQIQQVDSRAGAGSTFYSPIVVIHVR